MASCDATKVASVTTDRIVPSVSIDIESAVGQPGFDSVSVRAPLQIKISATDNAALLKVITRVFADTALIKADTASFPVSSTSYNRTLTVSLAGVRPGQSVTVRSQASDGAGNSADDQAAAVAFDPNVPKMAFSQPAATVIIGGTYSFDLIFSDSTGIAKAGYRASGAGVTKADSTLFPVPIPKVDTVSYLISIPSNAARRPGVWGADAPKVFASRTPDHGSGASGARRRSAPCGALA